MILNKDYKMLKWFVDDNHTFMRIHLYSLAKQYDRNLSDKIEREEWLINKTI